MCVDEGNQREERLKLTFQDQEIRPFRGELIELDKLQGTHENESNVLLAGRTNHEIELKPVAV